MEQFNTRTSNNDSANGTGLIGYFVNNSVAANLVMGLLLAGGFIAGLGLTAQVFPTIDPGIVTVTVPYPGATPSEVEESITRRVEEAVFGIDGVKKVVSKASENSGTITIELKDFVDDAQVRDDVEAAVEGLADFPPEEAEQPEVKRADTVSEVITLFVASELGEKSLRAGAENLSEELLALPTVTLVSLVGARDYEISIEVSEEASRQYNISINEIAAAIRKSSINLSSGELRTDAGDLLLRTNNKGKSGKDFADIVLRASADGSILRLEDVAVIRDEFANVDLIQEYNGRKSLFVKVEKSEAEDALEIAAEVKSFLTDYQPRAGLDIGIWEDQSEILQQRLNLLVRNGVLGFALVFLFLVIMLDLRLALWVAMGVPISFLGAFLFFEPFGVNINMISLFGLIIVLGVVVDDAVVVGENIITEQESMGPGTASTLKGVAGVSSPVTVGVLTTMAAFAPLLFVTGTFGQILGAVPIVVIVVLTISLIEVFFILPSHLAHGKPWSRGLLASIQAAVGTKILHFRDQIMVPAVAACVKRRYLTLLGGIGFLLLAGSLISSGAVRFIFFPDLESDSIRASLKFPVGTPFETTETAARRIVSAAYKVNEELGGNAFDAISATIGGSDTSSGGPGGQRSMRTASHIASVRIQLASEPGRALSAVALERLWRAEVGDISGVEALSFAASFFGSGPDVEFELAHQNDETLFSAVELLKSAYANLPAVYDIQDSFSIGKRQYDITLTATGEAAGLLPTDIARQLRNNFFGQEVQRIQRGRDELKVMVRYPESQRQSMRNLDNVRIHLADGTQVPLFTVASLTESRAFSSIDRVDGLRIVTVTGEVDTAIATPTQVNAQVIESILPQLTQRFPALQVNQAGQGRDEAEDMASLAQMMIIAMMTIFVLLASQLRSYTQPFVVLAGVPFGAAGAIVGHYLLGYNISFISIFGIVALSGVVVNDSLVLVDQYNRNRRETDASISEAIISASQRRFRAIFLTTATTALGLTPMLFESSTQAQFLVPMAVSLATGIVFASVIILFLVPALVVIREDFNKRFLPSPSDDALALS
ncbi:MAG: efflux RND transporter permease subunit [Pseudomonadales bacterium]|nr:efflux RND transporter permease subunit [Pseudomonadales bacterium]